MSAVDGFLAPVVTEVLLTGLSRLRAEGPGAHLFVGSTWLSNFPLFPGVFAGSFPYLLPDTEPNEVATIADVVTTWRARGGLATVLVQNYEQIGLAEKGQCSCQRRGTSIAGAPAWRRGAKGSVRQGFSLEVHRVP